MQDRDVDDLVTFGQVILVGASALGLAIAVRVIAGKLAVPPPAPARRRGGGRGDRRAAADALSFRDVQRIATVALVVILFEGGAKIGLRRFRESGSADRRPRHPRHLRAPPALVTWRATSSLDLSWTISGLIGAALSPTDPAVTFSVLAGREVEGRSGTILEGESGFNDPVGIALMIGVVEFATTEDGSFGTIVNEFVKEMAIGLAVGAIGGLALVLALKHFRIPDRSLYPLAVLLARPRSTGSAPRCTARASSPPSSPESSSVTVAFPERRRSARSTRRSPTSASWRRSSRSGSPSTSR